MNHQAIALNLRENTPVRTIRSKEDQYACL